MAGSIKGIIVEIGGDTSKLQSALKKVNSTTASLSKELRGINSLLKLDPKNTELVSQKQTVLKKSIEETSEKLKQLRNAQEEADKKIAEGGEISEENYRNLQREIINTENKLKELKLEASKWTQAGRSIEEFGKKIENISNKIDKMGTTLTTRLTLPIAGFATYAVKSFSEVDDGADIVIKKTGAIGDKAKELKKVYKNVSENVVGEFNDIGSAVGEINTRFEFTGDTLQKASEKFMKFAKINDIDVNTAVQKVSRYMGDASIESSKYEEVLDQLSAAAQVSGISVDSLAETCTKYGAPMRALGLNTKESIAIFAGWEKAGVNTEIAFSGMKKAISNWGKAGKDSSKEFKKTLEEIKKAPNIAKATSKAIEVFGAKAGPDLADAIKGGRFEYEKFLDVLEKSQGTLENTYNGVIDEADDVQLAMKKMKVQASEVGQEILKTLVPTAQKLLDSVSKLISDYNKLDDKSKQQIRNMVLLAAAIGPTLKVVGSLGKGISATVKGIGTFSQAIGVMKSGMESANSSANILAKGMSFFTSPAGAILGVIALGTAIAGISVAISKQRYAMDGVKKEMEEQQKSWENLKKTREENLNISYTEIETTQKIADELRNITDENGKVKDGYENRAKYILGELNKALGTEYTMTGNIIDKYQDLKKNIDKLIETKRVEATLDAYKGEYQEAIKKQADATRDLAKAREAYNEAFNRKTNGKWEEEERKRRDIAVLGNELKKQTALIGEYGYTIQNYEELTSASVSGNSEEIKKAMQNMATSYEQAKTKMDTSVSQQISSQSNYVQLLKQSWQDAKNNNDKFQEQILKKQYDTQQEELKNLVDSLVRQTSTVDELTDEQVQAWKDLADASIGSYGEGLSKLDEETRKKIQSATGIVNIDTSLSEATKNEAIGATTAFGRELKLISKTKENISEATAEMNNDTSASDAAGNLGSKVDTSYNEKIDPYTWGKDLCNLFADGIWKFMINPIGATVELAQKIKNNLGFSLPKEGPLSDFDKSMPDMMELMSKGINENQYKVIKSADNLAKNLYNALNDSVKFPSIKDFGKLQGGLSNRIIDSTKTIFTTPNLTIYTQEFDARKIADEVNRIFGSQY